MLAKNRDLRVLIRPSSIDGEKEALFEKHRVRFEENIPTSLFNFMSPDPASALCPNVELHEIARRHIPRIGAIPTSAVYASFDPTEAKRRLGIPMMLHSIEFSRRRGCRYYYPGCAYHQPFIYDDKKRFAGLEYLDWNTGLEIVCERRISRQ